MLSTLKLSSPASDSSTSSTPPIYLDYNATTPLHPRVIARISAALADAWQNPSSAYGSCEAIRAAIARARRQIGYAIGLLPEEAIDGVTGCSNVASSGAVAANNNFAPESIIFTSGGSESNNWAIDIAIKHHVPHARPSDQLVRQHRCHIIATSVEHDSIVRKLSRGTDYFQVPVDITFVKPTTEFSLNRTFSVDDFVSAIRDDTILITCIFAQNETGIIQPISALAEKLQEINESRHVRGLHRVLLHTDASQAIGKVRVDLTSTLGGVDMLTICGHKFNGPRIGALFLRQHTVLPVAEPFIYGGLSQEFGRRAGTQNTPMIVGLGEAAYLAAKELGARAENMLKKRNLLLQNLYENWPAEAGKEMSHANFDAVDGYSLLPNTLSVAFPVLYNTSHDESAPPPSHVLQQRLAARGVFCSTGSACHAGACKASQVLLVSGVSVQNALTTLRLSVGPSTTSDEVNVAAKVIAEEVKNLLQ